MRVLEAVWECLFYPISLLDETFNPRNKCSIPPVKCLIRLELEETKPFPNSLLERHLPYHYISTNSCGDDQ